MTGSSSPALRATCTTELRTFILLPKNAELLKLYLAVLLDARDPDSPAQATCHGCQAYHLMASKHAEVCLGILCNDSMSRHW